MNYLQPYTPILLPARATYRAFSFGGGVQSTAVLVMQARGLLRNPYDAFVFANVGEDSENPATLAYIEQHAKPYAQAHGIEFVELRKIMHGQSETLLHYIGRMERNIPIPVYMANGAPGNRGCTERFKIEVVDRWLRDQGLQRVIMGLGISLDEYWRARDTDWHDHHAGRNFGFAKKREYPLIEAMKRRTDCHTLITEAGLPVPPKSSCWFCPFSRRGHWQDLHDHQPEQFQKAIDLETDINHKRAALGRDRVFLHPSLRPLDQAVGDQLQMFPEWEMDVCESGYCMV